MNGNRKKKNRREIRHKRVRAKIFGTAKRPRLSVFRSNRRIFLQLIDDEKGKTIIGISDVKFPKTKKMTKTQRSFKLGRELAKLALAKKIKKALFDRGGFLYHGRVKAAAEGARKGGLQF